MVPGRGGGLQSFFFPTIEDFPAGLPAPAACPPRAPPHEVRRGCSDLRRARRTEGKSAPSAVPKAGRRGAPGVFPGFGGRCPSALSPGPTRGPARPHLRSGSRSRRASAPQRRGGPPSAGSRGAFGGWSGSTPRGPRGSGAEPQPTPRPKRKRRRSPRPSRRPVAGAPRRSLPSSSARAGTALPGRRLRGAPRARRGASHRAVPSGARAAVGPGHPPRTRAACTCGREHPPIW